MSRFPAVSAEGGTIASGIFQLGYSIEGSGMPLLVIGSHRYYRRTFSASLRDTLAMVFVDHRAFAPASGAVAAGDFGFDAVIADIERARARLGLDRFAILGHSGHGYMALEYARRHPERVSNVVMVGTAPSQSVEMMERAEERWQREASAFRRAVFEREMAKLPEDIAAHPAERFKHLLIRLGARSWYRPDFDARPLWEGVTVQDAGFDHLWGEVFRDFDMAAVAREVDAPVLLALGRHDYLIAPIETWSDYLPHFRDARMTVFERSGHTPQLEEPEAFDRELLAFLQGA